ncbi:MAG: glycoside hydrolase family 2 TIM barrel-domain containing protein [Bacteroidota bacterium]|nr:glycoside hydrolase family 2 TIM barrel-domain containing protein [Bacteroidota bacterium]
MKFSLLSRIQYQRIAAAVLAALMANVSIGAFGQSVRQKISFNDNWQFRNQEDLDQTANRPEEKAYAFRNWETVTLPHTAKVEPLVVVNPWVGISWYKKDFTPEAQWKGRKVFIEFEAVMQQAQVWLNGNLIETHYGGYLPFTIDITRYIEYGKSNRLVVKADNHDDANVPPGKPIKELDFCYYSGIYRNVSLIVTNPLHITDAVEENKAASGGVHVWYPEVSAQSATVAVATHVRNENKAPKSFVLTYALTDPTGKVVAAATSLQQTLAANADKSFRQNLTVKNPALWHPEHPNLYTLKISVKEKSGVVDQLSTRIGIRKFEINDERLLVNGEPLLLVGTNRHQEYPYIGNALSDNAQYRDAVKIKEAGFNIVRLCHYPQSPAFMDACDELGILTMDAIPGWQFVGKDTFQMRSYQDARELIRRDRNHASVAMWELSLNESPMPDPFMKKMNEIAREESPESKLYTCGWINKYYDIYIPARQHAKYPDYWKKYTGAIPLFTGEYGDWEYFAQDAGLNQAGYAGLKNDERTSRQLRGDGERRLLQQALNFQEAHNDNLRNPHLGDANWLMFDYNRGYSPDIESSGIMDIFRLPKYAYYFYRSQKSPDATATAYDATPTVKIASLWDDKSDKNVKVYSNCEEVALYLNGELIEKKKADRDKVSDHLNYPPFLFTVPLFAAGDLHAIGYIGGKVVKTDTVNTPGKAVVLKLSYDKNRRALRADGADAVFVYATLCDAKGYPVSDHDVEVKFRVSGDARLVGVNPVKAEAGVATILLQAGKKAQPITVEAQAEGLNPAKFIIETIQ